MEIQTVAPTKIRQGLTVHWTVDPGDDFRPEDGWACHYFFALSSGNPIDVTATDNGDGLFLVTITATITATMTATRYPYVGRASRAGEVYEVDSGEVEVLPALTAAAEGRSWARKNLDAVETELTSRISGGSGSVSSKSISTPGGTRSLQFVSYEELLALRSKLQIEVQREEKALRIQKGLNPRNAVFTRFAR